ncbi:MAG: DUF1493 family protein [Cyanobacteria bacterium HKST-UBA01]|nr:DUF1493 family protein [Cyanobacteria bacterium HKST-UBA01]
MVGPPGVDKSTYDRIVLLVEKHTGRKTINPDSRIQHDLGADGQDAYDLMVELQDKFDVDMTNFVFDRHFGPEAAWNPFVWIYWMICEREKLNKNCTAVKAIPVTVMDLYDAAKTRKFPDLSNREPE